MALTFHTSLGDLKVELECALVPKSCENVLALAASGTYDGTRFHRNIAGFMAQGGDPTGTGKGGESIWGGYIADEFHPDLKHDARGVVSLANRGPNTNGAQFFVTYGKQAHLDGVYTVVGRLIKGGDVLDAMERVPCGGKRKDKPLEPIVIKGVTIHANPFAEASG